MASATLKKSGPRRINTRGHIFERGVEVPVSPETASALKDDERFDVKLDPEPAVAAPVAPQSPAKPVRPEGKAERLGLIRAAIDELDDDNEEHWTVDGRPDARALTHVLGWQVTAEERDAALPKPEGGSAPAPRAGRVTVVRKAQETPPLDTGGEKAVADPSKEGAVEV